eukprot:TRINITY_DN74830_c0_g1_i1.p4 TRINITY_DN74830_c0_g1~~TRINITY_DN74830_c0_g1_i1.p4  ORF type:complete len:104 (+),score=9.89 TRINITY_DN74830_c0_g1_i1:168-479(+)
MRMASCVPAAHFAVRTCQRKAAQCAPGDAAAKVLRCGATPRVGGRRGVRGAACAAVPACLVSVGSLHLVCGRGRPVLGWACEASHEGPMTRRVGPADLLGARW